MKRFLILSDSAFFRESVSSIISLASADSKTECEVFLSENALHLISECREREENMQTRGKTCVFVDLSVDGEHGMELAKTLFEACPGLPVVLHLPYTAFDIFTFYEKTPRNVIAVIDKDTSIGRFYIIAMEMLLEKEFSSPQRKRLSGLLKAGVVFKEKEHLQETSAVIARLPSLSNSEETVFNYLAFGYDDGEIAEKIDVSPHTVRKHLDSIKRKLEEFSRYKLISISAFSYIRDPWRKRLRDFDLSKKRQGRIEEIIDYPGYTENFQKEEKQWSN